MISNQIYTEHDLNANDYLGQLCTHWEAKADQFINLGCKVSRVRTGIVLSSKGGVLPKMMFPINWFLGAALGSGKQIIPWIHIDDLCAIYIDLINEHIPSGVYNGVAPEIITNNDFKTNENLFIKKNKFKGKIGIFEINKKTITHQLNFYEIQEENFKEIF